MIKTTTGTGEIDVTFNNTGTVNVESGTLILSDGGESNGGIFNLSTGGTLSFAGGSHTLKNGTEIKENGKLQVTNGTLDLQLTGGTAIANTVLFNLNGGTF
ncbi:MAG: hypothetical protein AAF063_33915, partial [Cyanobacteria bacterium J06643_5]